MYTYKQLLKIVATKQAIPGKLYYQDNGDVFIGSESRNLIQWQKASQNVFESKSINSKVTESAISEVDSKSEKGINKLNLDFSKSFLLMGG